MSQPARVAVSVASRASVAALLGLVVLLSATLSSPAGAFVAPPGGSAPTVGSVPVFTAAFPLPAQGGGDPGGPGGPGGCGLAGACGGSPGFPGVGGGDAANQGGASSVSPGDGPKDPAPSSPASGGGSVLGWVQEVFTGGSAPAPAPASSGSDQDRPVVSTTREVGQDPRSGRADSDPGSLFGWLSAVVRGDRDPATPPQPRPDTARTVKNPQGETENVRKTSSVDEDHSRLFQLLGLLLGLIAVGGGLAHFGIVGFVRRRSAAASEGPGTVEEDAPADPGRAEATGPIG